MDTKAKLGQHCKNIIFSVILFSLFFIVIEGLSSYLYFFRNLNISIIPERHHTQYDAFLGWSSIPNLYIKDLYGPGKYLRTNSQGFRNDQDFSVRIPDNKLRIVCSGDSLTLGWGVSNEENWTRRLETIDSRLQTVNMGQGGYGIDQMYLWYTRDGVKLDHNVQVLAFITDDIERMKPDRLIYFSYYKPTLRLVNDDLVVEGIPVPKKILKFPIMNQNISEIYKLNFVRIFFDIKKKLSALNQVVDPNSGFQARPILMKIIENLDRINRRKGSTLLVVYLPIRADYDGRGAADWRSYFSEELHARNIAYLDLISEYKNLPSPLEADKWFTGHYSVEGNERVANLINAKLRSMPEVNDRLNMIAPAN